MNKLTHLAVGPVDVSEEVKKANGVNPVTHRAPIYKNIVCETKANILNIAGVNSLDYQVTLMSGSGHAANCMMLQSFLNCYSGKVLFIDAGVYGKRLVDENVANGLGGFVYNTDDHYQNLKYDLINKVCFREGIKALVLVHHETSISRMENLDALLPIIKEHNLDVYIDAISSFGAYEIDFNKYNICGLTFSANKCIHGYPGIAGLIHKKSLSAANQHACTFLNADSYRNGIPFTMPYQVVNAFNTACKELIAEGGPSARNKKYKEKQLYLWQEMDKLGFTRNAPDSMSSVCVTTFNVDKLKDYDISFNVLYKRMYEEGFIIYHGAVENTFRIGNMGEITINDLKSFIKILRRTLLKEQ